MLGKLLGIVGAGVFVGGIVIELMWSGRKEQRREGRDERQNAGPETAPAEKASTSDDDQRQAQ